jgi:carbamoyltransferase
MITLGLNGGIDFPYENEFNFQSVDLHDAAAALVVDGKVVSAIEEERLNRIKHSNKTSLFSAARFVLEDYGITINDVDKICYYLTEDTCNWMLKAVTKKDFAPIRSRLLKKIKTLFNTDIDEKKLHFVHHHLAHAISTFKMSGFDESLIVSIDAGGDGISGMILDGKGNNMEVLEKISLKNSFGTFYTGLIGYLGFRHFDEYKVMGLAPYGNPETYREVFKAFYRLLPDGKYEIYPDYFHVLNHLEGIPRDKNDPFTKVHQDVAASIQDTLEKMVFHVLENYNKKYNHKRLCLAGGVAQNCTINGKLLYSGMYEDIFVQPASYDAGTAIGAAMYAYYETHKEDDRPYPRLETVYWGSPIGSDDEIGAKLKAWESFVEYEKVDNITEATARLLADGAVVGWSQGRSEFGPRALGNRSILADPRPAENKDVINAMVKKREAFRPFAPSVLEEYVEEYYEVPADFKYKKFPFMTFVLDVKKEKQEILGAVTHVDGTARIQSVSKEQNEKYWELIDEFRKLTEIPILLNTSFNNNVEPIVNSFEDSIVCFLTTKINYLVVGNYLIKKKAIDNSAFLHMVPSIPLHITLSYLKKSVSLDQTEDIYEIRDNFLKSSSAMSDRVAFSDFSFGLVKSSISRELFSILGHVDGKKALSKLMNNPEVFDGGKRNSIIDEIKSLWTLRLIRLDPTDRE